MNALLQTISVQASDDLKKLIEEGHDDILKAIHKTEEEAQANEQKPKFTLGFKISMDLDKAVYTCDLSWNLKQTLGVSHSIDDPNQGKLPLPDGKADAAAQTGILGAVAKHGTTMTMITGGKSVTITPAKAKRAIERIEKAQKEGKL